MDQPKRKLKNGRLDLLLVDRKLARDAKTAQALIMAGCVSVDGLVVTKPGTSIKTRSEISVKDQSEYASRGGDKLAHALTKFGICVDGLVCADSGCSTGGFTDVLLKGGAAKVYAIDSAYGELAWDLRTNAKVEVMERTNILSVTSLPEPIDFVSLDLSLLSLRKALPVVMGWLKSTSTVVALLKPQYEATPQQLPPGAIITDRNIHAEIIRSFLEWTTELPLRATDFTTSPITGKGGNREFLVRFNNSDRNISQVIDLALAEV